MSDLPKGWTRIGPWTRRLTLSLDDGRIIAFGEVTEIFDGERWETVVSPSSRDRDRRFVCTAEGWVMAVGGGEEPSAACELLDPAKNMWHPMPDLPEPRAGHTVVMARGQVFVIGGFTQEKGRVRSVLAWMPGAATWEIVTELPVVMDAPRAIGLADGSIVVWGAWGSEAYRWNHSRWVSIGKIDTDSGFAPLAAGGFFAAGGRREREFALALTRMWTPKGGWRTWSPMPKARSRPAVIQLIDGRVAILGGVTIDRGWEDAQLLRWTHYEFKHRDLLTEAAGSWDTVAAPELDAPVVHALHDGRIVVFDRDVLIWKPPNP